MRLPAVFDRYRTAVDRELRSALSDYRSPLFDMLRYHLGWIDEHGKCLSGASGKALRPTLCLLACEAAGDDYRRALPAAAALELVHNFSLIHDDIQDDDRQRRHRSTVWSIWGKPQAINAGTAMHLISNLELLRMADSGVPPERVIRAQRLLDQSCLRLIEGQYLDISYESRVDISVADYLTMIQGKTAQLIACSLQLGALVGTEEEHLIQGLERFGWHLGVAFQIRDDILGIWGDEAQTGKSTGNDILKKKKSFPVVYALEQTRGTARETLLGIYRQGAVDQESLATVLAILGGIGAQAAAQRMVERYGDLAAAALADVTLPAMARADLSEIAQFLTGREY